MCAGACGSFNLGRRYVLRFLLLRRRRYSWTLIFSDREVGCTTVKEDNKGAIYLAIHPVTAPNSKYIDIRHHFLLERVGNEEFEAVHVQSAEQRADIIAKPLHTEALRFHRTFVMKLGRFHSFAYFQGILFFLADSNGERLRELEKVLGGTHASDKDITGMPVVLTNRVIHVDY